MRYSSDISMLAGRKLGLSNWHYELSEKLLLVSLSVIPFLVSMDGQFVFDDAETMINNPVVNGKTSVFKVFSHDYWGRPISSISSHKSYRPVTTLTFWLNYKLHGEWTIGYHWVNIVLHCLVTLLVYRMTCAIEHISSKSKERTLTKQKSGEGCLSFPTAVAFAVHPIHTEAIANISGRAELLMTLFFLEALLLFINSRENVAKDAGCSVVFAILVLLSVLSKEQGIMVVPMCVMIDLSLSCRLSTLFSRRLLFLIFIFLSLVYLRLFVNDFSAPVFTQFENSAAFIANPYIRLTNYCYIWLYNLYLLLLPTSLCFDYSMGCIPLIDNFTDLRAIALLIVVIFPFIFSYVINRMDIHEASLARFAFLLGTLSFLPASNLLVTVGFTIAERVLYLPSIAYCMLLAILYNKTKNRLKNIEILAFLVIGLASGICYQRSVEWRNELSLYSSGLSVCPNNAKIHYNLGKVLGDQGEEDKAEQNYLTAIRLNPQYENALNNLANILEKKGKRIEAEQLLTRAVKIRPSFATAWMNLGITQMNMKKYQESFYSFQQSISLRPFSADCLFNLGNLYQRTNHPHQAMDSWKNATRIDPTHIRSWINLLVVLDELNDCDKVLQLSVKALEAGPNNAAIHFQLGSCLGKKGQYKEAEEFLKNAIHLSPENALYHANLGVLYQRWHRFGLAAMAYRKSLAIDSSLHMIKENLIQIQTRIGNKTRIQ